MWPHRRRTSEADDEAPPPLIRAAAAIEAQGAKALRGRARVDAARAMRRPRQATDRHPMCEWHSDTGDAVDLTCTISASQACRLLHIVLGGPASDEPTPLERNIVRETVERLLTATGRLWEERASLGPPPDAAWVCELTIADAVGTTSSIELRAPAPVEEQATEARVDLSAVSIALEAVLPPSPMHVVALAGWRCGDVIPLGCDAKAATRLEAGGAVVAYGTLGALRGRRAVLVGSELGEPGA